MYQTNAITAVLPSQGEYLAELETLREETFANIITGVASLDSYDEYVEEWMAMGGDILTEFGQKKSPLQTERGFLLKQFVICFRRQAGSARRPSR
jgi:hypothetical protein